MAEKCKIPSKRSDKVTFWTSAVQAWKRSGLSQSQFCQEKGLSCSTFKYWNKESAIPGVKQSNSEKMTPVLVPFSLAHLTCEQNSTPALISLNIHDHFRIDIHDGFCPDTLKKIVRVLEGLR